MTVTATQSNLRSQPSLTAPVVGQSGKGTRLTLTGTVGDWTPVKRADGQTAYIHQSVARKGGNTVLSRKGEVTVTPVCSANIRKAPSTPNFGKGS